MPHAQGPQLSAPFRRPPLQILNPLPHSSSSHSNPYPCTHANQANGTHFVIGSELGHMVYCWTCGDYALCLNLWRLCSARILCLHFLWLPPYYFPAWAMANIPLISLFFSLPNIVTHSLFTFLSIPFCCSAPFIPLPPLFSFIRSSPLHSPPLLSTSPPLGLWLSPHKWCSPGQMMHAYLLCLLDANSRRHLHGIVGLCSRSYFM